MTKKELKRFNRGNEISKQLEYYTQQLTIVKNKKYVNDDYSLINEAVIVMFEFIIKKLKSEFSSL